VILGFVQCGHDALGVQAMDEATGRRVRTQDIRRTPSQRRQPARAGLSEIVLVISGILVYFGVRGITATDPQAALSNALEVVSVEKGLGVYVEPSLQELASGSTWTMTAMNWVYIWGHWPMIIATLVWLFARHPAGYRQIRNAMLISGGIGLLVFAVFPVAPPRLAELGLVDTVTESSKAYRVLQPPAFVNQYAAMPSLHVGWDLVMGVALFTYGRMLLVRLAGVVLPILMATSVVLTANHYVIDAAVGAALVVFSLFVSRRLGGRRPEASRPVEQRVPPHAIPAPRAPTMAPSERCQRRRVD
jgi:PAP2 superfamily